MPIPEWKWEHVIMDFVMALPRSPKGNNAVWVVVNRLTKSAHFIPFRVGQSAELLADKYMREIVRLHEISVSIVLDRGTRFRSHFWERPSKKFRDPSKVQHVLSPRDRRTIRANNTNLRRYVESMYDGLQGIVGRLSAFGRILLQ